MKAGELAICIGDNKGCEGEYRTGIIRIELGEGFLILARRRRLARLAVRQSNVAFSTEESAASVPNS
jgi:hypothetical protein